jgi:hypothetical protein
MCNPKFLTSKFVITLVKLQVLSCRNRLLNMSTEQTLSELTDTVIDDN